MVEQTSTGADVISDLEEWRIVQPKQIEGVKTYDETDREIVKACGELARFGIAGRNLRAIRTAADREAQLLEQVIGPALQSVEPDPPQGGDREPRDARGDHRAASPTCSWCATCAS